jgi:hypothetical protein
VIAGRTTAGAFAGLTGLTTRTGWLAAGFGEDPGFEDVAGPSGTHDASEPRITRRMELPCWRALVRNERR